jgi:hypothetical protein
MSVELKKMEIWVNRKDFFEYRKGDQMVASKNDWKLPFRDDLVKGLSDEIDGSLFLSQRELKISHIVQGQLVQVASEIGAEGLDPPGGLADGRGPKPGARTESSRSVVGASKDNYLSFLERRRCRDEAGFQKVGFHEAQSLIKLAGGRAPR